MLTLLYHNILTRSPDGLPIASLQVSLEDFRKQLVRMRHRLLDPREVHDALRGGHKPKGVLITFDDGAWGFWKPAARLLRSAVSALLSFAPERCGMVYGFIGLAIC